MTGRLRTSAEGLELIKSFEGFRETATRLPDGRWTIGYGHVRTAREGLTISQKDAEDLLTYDLKPVEDAVASYLYAPLLQNQFDALTDFAYNCGAKNLLNSTLLKRLNDLRYDDAAEQFDKWVFADGKILPGLVKRRAAERILFETP